MRPLWLILMGGLWMSGWAQAHVDEPPLVIQVVDSHGNPIADALVRITLVDKGFVHTINWAPVNSKGRYVLDTIHWLLGFSQDTIATPLEKESLLVQVRSPSHVPAKVRLKGKLPRVLEIPLRPAKTLDLKIYTHTGEPFTPSQRSPDSLSEPMYSLSGPIYLVPPREDLPLVDRKGEQEFYEPGALSLSLGIIQIAPGHYRCVLPADYDRPVYLLVSDRQMKGYVHTIEPSDYSDGVVEVRLPQPATLRVKVDYRALLKVQTKGQLFVSVSREDIPQTVRRLVDAGNPFQQERAISPEGQAELLFSSVSEGKWRVRASVWESWGHVSAAHSVVVKVGERVEVGLQLRPLNPADYRGTRMLTVEVRKTSGQPARFAPYKLLLWAEGQRVSVSQGRLDARGRATLRNLYENRSDSDGERVSYVLIVADEELCEFALVRAKPLKELKLVMPPRVGDPAPDVTVLELATQRPLRLSSLRGRWIYLEFWATWCGPCQIALAELAEILQRHSKQWTGRLEVVTVSIDDGHEGVKTHLERKGWWNLPIRHCWDIRRNEREGNANRAYGIRYVPSAFLIDPSGKIVWFGNPLAGAETVLKRYLGGGR